jgi:hypothetical protein
MTCAATDFPDKLQSKETTVVDIESLVKEAVWIGLAGGVIIMAAVLVYAIGNYLLTPQVAVVAAIKPPFGFQPGS